MSLHITVLPSGRTFLCHPDETLLASAIRQEIGLPYACRDGACGACRCRKLEGQVCMDGYQPRALSEADVIQNYILTCRARPQTDIVIQARQVAGGFPIKKMPVRVLCMQRKSHDVMQINMQLPGNVILDYHAGQFVEFILKDGSRRSYSMANAPHIWSEPGKPSIELHVRHLKGGKFSGHVFSRMQEKEILRIEGPFGSFFLREDSVAPIVFLATGTGFAPIKAIIEHMQFKNIPREATLYWGGRHREDLYMCEWIEEKCRQMSNLNFVPVLSDSRPEDNWIGRIGYAHHAVLVDFHNLKDHQVYACGSPIMVEMARNDFVTKANLPSEEFYADAFVNESDK